jgi:hypothetical protein
VTIHRRRRAAPAAGSIGLVHKSPRTSISFEEEMFRRIQAEADRRGFTFGAVVREKLAQVFQIEYELSREVVENVDNSVEIKDH